ncbi:hypothetical protein [Gemmobacter nectariphilus]|uniref:hypothetical protein n=1 Tax=Gemmobacter nectariphilus TaxID=220343 RepID=UPI001378F949|nr:hypothetical protein [Gemmobacter nectariphilus]
MFAPEGYCPFASLYHRIDIEAACFEHEFVRPHYSSFGEDIARERARRIRVAYRDWLVDWVLLQFEYKLYLSSPTGKLVRIDKAIFVAQDRASFYKFDWPPKQGCLAGEAITAIDFGRNWPLRRFEYAFFTGAGWTVDPQREREGGPYPYIIDEVRRILQRFKGWSLCVTDKDSDAIIENLRKLHPVRTVMDPPKVKIGRPSVQEEAYRTFTSCYPEGKTASVTWKDIEARTGFPVSTIKRALANFEGPDQNCDQNCDQNEQ